MSIFFKALSRPRKPLPGPCHSPVGHMPCRSNSIPIRASSGDARGDIETMCFICCINISRLQYLFLIILVVVIFACSRTTAQTELVAGEHPASNSWVPSGAFLLGRDNQVRQ